MSLWIWAVGPRRCAPRIALTKSCEIETTKKENAFSRGTAQVTTAETGCGSCLLRVFEPCRRASRPVARFWGLEGQNTFLWGHDFCFYEIFKTNFLGTRKFGGTQKKFGGNCPWMPSRGYGPMYVWNFAHPGLSDRNKRRVKFTQPWNSAARNCKSSFRKCLFA